MSTTSFAILGLLAIQPWSTYELIRQVDRSLRRMWPRAQSKLYEEPKKLVELGLARASEERVGRRRRTVYTITPKGRRALAQWVGEPGSGPQLEFEQLLKIHFADSTSKADVIAQLEAAREWARAENVVNLEVARAYQEGTGPFPDRAAINSLGGAFLTRFYAMVFDWAEWALGVVEQWPDDVRLAERDQKEMQRLLRVAERINV
jgi:DNA-binding PadR family transcriptional regulator